MEQEQFDKNVVIYADHRESSSRIIPILKKFCDVREEQLAVGDYILSERVCAERKTSADFISSIIDKRIFGQLSSMKSSYSNPVLIIEGEHILDAGKNIHPNALRGAIASICIDYSVPIIWTTTQMDTANQLMAIARREQLDEKKAVQIRGKKKPRSMAEAQEFLISGIPKISSKKASALLEHFGTPEKIFSASEEELMQAEGIGPELARQIRRIITQRYMESEE